jgi:suppressor for copper-sensitivity B
MPLARLCIVFTFVMSASFTGTASSSAHAAATAWSGDRRAAVRLITATNAIAGQSTLEAGLEFRFAKGWHGYWRTPGDAGVAPDIDWSGSENIRNPEIAWPAPHRLVIDDLQSVVYDGDVILSVKLYLNEANAPARIKLSVGYAICSDICVPLQAALALALPRGARQLSSESAAIASARTGVPGTIEAAGITVRRAGLVEAASGPSLVVDLQSDREPFAKPDLFVEGIGDGIPPAPQVLLQDGGKTVRLTVGLAALPRTDRPLTLTLTDGGRAAEFQLPLPKGLP